MDKKSIWSMSFMSKNIYYHVILINDAFKVNIFIISLYIMSTVNRPLRGQIV